MNNQGKHFIQIVGTVIVSLVVIGLAGCGQQNKTSESSSKKTTSQVTKSKQSSASSKVSSKSASSSASSQKVAQTTTLWDTAKDQKLKAFIDQWAPTMGQSYTEYDGHTPLKTSTGTTYPDALNGITIEGASGTIGWSASGDGDYDYNVVAIYNYDGTEPPLPNHITYVFAFHDKQPVVLVDQTRDGSPILTQTQNTDMKSGFEQVAAGKATAKTTNNTSSSSATSQNTALDAKTIGLLLMELRGDDVTQERELYVDKNTATYPYLASNGYAVGQIPYRYTNTEVTYGVRDPNYTDAENVFIEHTVSLQTLRDKYYHTAAQIAAIKTAVARVQN